MSKKKKPKTPESEKVQAQTAKQFFDKGTAIKGRIGKDFLSDLKRDPRGRIASRQNADMALSQKRAFQAQRGKKRFQTAAASIDGGVEGMAAQNAGGVQKFTNTARRGKGVTQQAEAVSHTLSLASKVGHNKEMARFDSKMATMDAIGGAAVTAASNYGQASDYYKANHGKNQYGYTQSQVDEMNANSGAIPGMGG